MDKQKIGAFADQIFEDIAGFATVAQCYLATRSGLFAAMAEQGPLSIAQAAERAGLQPRYVEECLKGLVAAGYVEYDAAADAYSLPPEHAYLLAAEGTDHTVAGLYYQAIAAAAVAPRVAQAFREGGGVPFDVYGEEFVHGLDMANRGIYEQRLASYWLQAMPDVIAKLEAGGSALDVGCGSGRATLALAAAFPTAHCVGLDLDAASIERARAAAEAAGLGARTEFVSAPLAELEAGRQFDLITCFDCVHDFAQPVPVLREIRARLTDDGALFIVEPRVADELLENRNPIATMFYGFSILHCMPQSLAQGGVGLGGCMGPRRTEHLLREAGFTRFEPLAIKSMVNVFYAARH